MRMAIQLYPRVRYIYHCKHSGLSAYVGLALYIILPITHSNLSWGIAQNPLHTFPRNFSVDGKVANLLRTC